MIYDRIQTDIKEAMLSKNCIRRDCLRSLVSEIKNQTVNAGRELTEDICMKVIRHAAKQREDSIESFRSGGRDDLAAKEQEELGYIKAYLPQVLSEDETRKASDEILSGGIEPVKKNMGVIMKAFGPNVDRKIASKLLQGILK